MLNLPRRGTKYLEKTTLMAKKMVEVAILVSDAVLAVTYHLFYTPHNSMLAYCTCPPHSTITLIYIYLPPGENSSTVFSLLSLMRTIFEGSHRFVNVGDLNAGPHKFTWFKTLSCLRTRTTAL